MLSAFEKGRVFSWIFEVNDIDYQDVIVVPMERVTTTEFEKLNLGFGDGGQVAEIFFSLNTLEC